MLASTVEFPLSTLFKNGSRSDLLDINQGLYRSSSVQSNLVSQSKQSTDQSYSSSEKIMGSPKTLPRKASSAKNGMRTKFEAPVVLIPPARNDSSSSLSRSVVSQFKNTAPRPRQQSPLPRICNGNKSANTKQGMGNMCDKNNLYITGSRSMTPDRIICGTALTDKCRKFAVSTQKISLSNDQPKPTITVVNGPIQNGTAENHVVEQNGTSESNKVLAISPDVLSELLVAAVMRVLMLDCRGFTSYNNNHIIGALNVSCADCISRKRLTCGKATVGDMIKGGDEAKQKYQKALSDEKVQLLVYDDSTTDFEGLADTHSLKVVLNNLRKSGYDAYYLHVLYYGSSTVLFPCIENTAAHYRSLDQASVPAIPRYQQTFSGLEAFSKKYEQMCSAEVEPKPKPLLYSPTNNVVDSNIDTATISLVLPHLYVGNERDAASRDILNENGITHILNVTSQIPLHFESSDLIYKRLPASDSGNQNLKQYFQEALNFIDDAASTGGKVLVHCQAGVSRSATIAIAYIMVRLKMRMLDAFRYVKARRPIVAPNFNFMGQLLAFEVSLYGEKPPEEETVSSPVSTGPVVVNGCVTKNLEMPDTPADISTKKNCLTVKQFFSCKSGGTKSNAETEMNGKESRENSPCLLPSKEKSTSKQKCCM